MTAVAEQLPALVASDGLSLPYRHFPAAGGHRGAVVHLHGIQSHGGWYVDTAAELARRGYSVYLPDRRGSGLSPGPRGDFRRPEQLVDDVARFVELARRDEPGASVFLIGGCWGARPALSYALEAQGELAGLALVCPAIRVKIDLSPPEKLKVLAGGLVGPAWRVRIPLEPELFTSDPEYLRFIREDPLALRDVTARFFFRQFLWDRALGRRRDLFLPLLLLQSGRDRIVDVDGVQAWFDRLVSPDKRVVVYPDFDHLLDFGEGRQRYWDDLVAWLDETGGGAR